MTSSHAQVGQTRTAPAMAAPNSTSSITIRTAPGTATPADWCLSPATLNTLGSATSTTSTAAASSQDTRAAAHGPATQAGSPLRNRGPDPSPEATAPGPG